MDKKEELALFVIGKIEELKDYYENYTPSDGEYRDASLEAMYEIIAFKNTHFDSNSDEHSSQFRDRVLSYHEKESFHEKPSESQLKAINIIESNLNLRFTGYSKDDATNFISEYIEESKKCVSSKQKQVIEMIRRNTGKIFEGATREEATIFIETNMGLSKNDAR